MRILICFYEINNFGGILLNQEALHRGLTELGHKVETVCLYWKDSVKPNSSSKGTEESVIGGHYDYEVGWTRMPRFAYKGKENLKRWKGHASKFDLIIWQIPVPSKAKEMQGNIDWLELYNVSVKQIAFVHDGNMLKQYPHIYAIADHLTGVVGVHPCAYHSLAKLPVPRAMAFSPQADIKQRMEAAHKTKKERSGWFSLQTFKAWKHVDDIVRAVPYMAGGYNKILAGAGIHHYYMTSKDKLLPEYQVNREADPDCSKSQVGKRIWDLALDGGLDYRSWVTNEQRETILHSAVALIDPSWSISYAHIGDHFNRVVVDGIIAGAVPIARDFGVSTNEEGNGELFKHGVNYYMIKHDATPKEFASLVDMYVGPTFKKDRTAVLEAGRELLSHFDYRVTAQTFIDLANGKPAGFYKNISKGKYHRKTAFAGKYLVENFFNDQPSKSGGFLS